MLILMGALVLATMTMHGMPVGSAGGDGDPYLGPPDSAAAASLLAAGGGPGHFSGAKALAALAGDDGAEAEVAKLKRQYGERKVALFATVQDFAVNDAARTSSAMGVRFPKPSLTGSALARRLVELGTQNGTFYEGVMLDRLFGHQVHEAMMTHIDMRYGPAATANLHRIADQARYDLAQSLGMTNVALAAFH